MSDATIVHIRKSGFRSDQRFRFRVAVDGIHSRKTVSNGKTFCGDAPTDQDVSREDAAGTLRHAPLVDRADCREMEFFKRVKEDAAKLCPACVAALAKVAKP